VQQCDRVFLVPPSEVRGVEQSEVQPAVYPTWGYAWAQPGVLGQPSEFAPWAQPGVRGREIAPSEVEARGSGPVVSLAMAFPGGRARQLEARCHSPTRQPQSQLVGGRVVEEPGRIDLQFSLPERACSPVILL